MTVRLFAVVLIVVVSGLCVFAADAQQVSIVVDAGAVPRVNFGANKVADALESVGFEVVVVKRSDIPAGRPLIVVGNPGKGAAVRSLVESGALKLQPGLLLVRITSSNSL